MEMHLRDASVVPVRALRTHTLGHPLRIGSAWVAALLAVDDAVPWTWLPVVLFPWPVVGTSCIRKSPKLMPGQILSGAFIESLVVMDLVGRTAAGRGGRSQLLGLL